MRLWITLAALLAVAAPMQDQGGDGAAAAVVPILGEDVPVVVRLDLTRWDVPATVRGALGELADVDQGMRFTKAIGAWVDMLKDAGAKDLFLLLDPTDLPRMPTAAVPLTGRADGPAIARVLSE